MIIDILFKKMNEQCTDLDRVERETTTFYSKELGVWQTEITDMINIRDDEKTLGDKLQPIKVTQEEADEYAEWVKSNKRVTREKIVNPDPIDIFWGRQVIT